MTDKYIDAFRTISEVSAALDVPPHVLRFWETKFTSLRPLKRSGGRRYYRPDDIAVLTKIRDLLYKDGFTIKGAQRFLKSKEALAPRSRCLMRLWAACARSCRDPSAESARDRLVSAKSKLHP